MKVAIITERADVGLGGAERSVFELANRLAELGVKVELLVAKGRPRADFVRVLCKGRGGRTSLLVFGRALKKHLAQNQYDIIHSVLPFGFADVYQPRGGSYAESIIRNAASYQNILVGSYKKITSFANVRRTILLQAEKKICRDGDGPMVAVLSNYVKEQFEKHYALGNERIAVIANGVETGVKVDKVQAEKLKDKILARARAGGIENPAIFLFAANNFRLKGLADLIKAMRVLKKRELARKAFVVVAGRGKVEEYRDMARKAGVGNRVIFIGHLKRIQNILAVSDVAILPTWYDPASRFILEGLAAGKPVVTTSFNGATDLFTNDRHVKVVYRPGDIEGLAEAMAYYCEVKNCKEASKAIAKDSLKDKISIDRHVQQLTELYETILKKR